MKIRNQLFFILFGLGILFTLSCSILIYNKGKKTLLNKSYKNLEAISQAKKIQIQEIVRLQYDKLQMLSNRKFIIDNISNLLKTKNPDYRNKVDTLLRDYISLIPDFNKIHIINKNGTLICSSDSTLTSIAHDKKFNGINQGASYLGNFFNNNNNQLGIVGGLPIIKDTTIAYLLVEFKATSIINLTKDYTGLEKTGETILTKQIGNDAIIINPTRFDPNAALRIKIPIDNPKYGLENAIKGEVGIYSILDYRNKEVIASIRKIDETGWILITQINKEEIEKSTYSLRNYLILINIFFILLAFLVSYFMGRYLAKPVEELIESTNRIKHGDLRSRVKSKYNNELGTLSESFNDMADQLERKINELDKVGFVISHDLKAPLNSIIPLTDFIIEDNRGKLTDETHNMLKMIKEKSLLMKELIGEILATAKSEKKTKEYVDVDSLVSNIISNLNPPSSIQLFIQQNLPIIYFHKISLMQVFQNLIQNAIKYMDKEKGLIKIGYSEDKSSYKFWVMDNGPGIKKELHKSIFNIFETANTENKVESTGIGLGVAKKIIEDNKGKIWIESDIGQGSSFFFTIPKP